MLQPLSPIDHSSYLDQQSDRKFKKKPQYHPVEVQKSPHRDVQNRNILSNRPFTPAKKNNINGSPLKSISSISSHHISKTRDMSTYSIKKSKIHNQTVIKDVPNCHNHPAKIARYVIETEDEQIPYCQKCSILLASQGFKVIKLDETAVSVQNSFTNNKKQVVQLSNYQRQNEVNDFLNNLQSISFNLKLKRSQAQTKMNSISQQNEQKIQQIQTYFQELCEMIQQYKLNLMMNMNSNTESRKESIKKYLVDIDQCLEDADMMKEDILTSLEIIQQVEDRMFKKVMESYKAREQSFKDQLTKPLSGTGKELNLQFLTNGARMEVILRQLASFKTNHQEQSTQKTINIYNNHSINSDNQNPIIQESSEQENLLKNNLSNNQSYFKQFE